MDRIRFQETSGVHGETWSAEQGSNSYFPCSLELSMGLEHCVPPEGPDFKNSDKSVDIQRHHDGNLQTLEGLVQRKNWIYLVEVQRAGRGQQPRCVIKANVSWEFTVRWHCANYIIISLSAPQTDKVSVMITPIIQMRKMRNGKIK